MLETFRKYTGLMFVVLILLFIGLVFFGSSGQSLGGKKVVTAHGRGFTQNDFRRFAENPTRLIGALIQSTQFRAYQPLNPYITAVGGGGQSQDQVLEFLVNRLSLQKAMKEFGVYASTAEIETFLKEEIFWNDGAFDQEAYLEFEKNELQPLGMTLKDLNELMGEVIAVTKLGEFMGAGVEASKEVVLQNYLARDQRVSYKLVPFPLTKYELDQDPSEEDITAEWEANKSKYLSKAMRKVSYIVAKPDFDALEKAKAEREKKAKEADGEAKPTTPEGEAPKPKPVVDPPVKLDQVERNAAIIELGTTFDMMFDELYDGASIDSLATKYNLKLSNTELVEKEALPAELTANLQDARNKSGSDSVFEALLEKPKVHRLGEDQWLCFQVKEIVEPKELTYEEARENVRLDLVKSRAMKAMEEDAKEKRKAVAEAIAGGKTFAEATAALELKPISRSNVTMPRGGAGAAMTEFREALKTNPGELSEVFTEDNETLGIKRSFFLLVDKREVYENTNLDTLIEAQVDSATTRDQNLVLYNWFAEQRATADLRLAETK